MIAYTNVGLTRAPLLRIIGRATWAYDVDHQSTLTSAAARKPGAPAGFQTRVGKIRREAPKNFFRLPTLVFSLPTLPYVTVAHPAQRTEADLTNQEGPSPPLPLT